MLLNGRDIIVMDLETAENILKIIDVSTKNEGGLKQTMLMLLERDLISDLTKLREMVRDLKE